MTAKFKTPTSLQKLIKENQQVLFNEFQFVRYEKFIVVLVNNFINP